MYDCWVAVAECGERQIKKQCSLPAREEGGPAEDTEDQRWGVASSTGGTVLGQFFSLTVLPWLLPLRGLQPFFYTCLLPFLYLHLIQGCFTYVRCMFLIFLVMLGLPNSQGYIPSVTSKWLWFVFIPPASAIILCLHPGGPLLHITAASKWLLVLPWVLFLCRAGTLVPAGPWHCICFCSWSSKKAT